MHVTDKIGGPPALPTLPYDKCATRNREGTGFYQSGFRSLHPLVSAGCICTRSKTSGIQGKMTTAEALNFRLARSSDYDKILKLSEGIYDGLDYLPAIYHRWLKMKNLEVMLAFSGEKLVSLAACSIVDEGKTFVSRAGRTLREFRGQGILTQLSTALVDFARRQYPCVRRWRFTSHSDYKNFKKLMLLEVLNCFVDKMTLRSQEISEVDAVEIPEIQSCSKKYLCDVIFSGPVASKLFPNNTILLNWLPIEPLPSNIDHLMQENGDLAVHFAVEKCTDDTSPRSVSLAVLSQRVKCMEWLATIYTSDEVLYHAHLVHQFKLACETIKGADFMFVCCQDQAFTNRGRKVLKDLLRIKLDEKIVEESTKLYEVDFPLLQSHV